MTTPLADLFDSDDLDSYNARDPEWLLKAAGDLIRQVCGWHIAPSVVETGVVRRIAANGTIMLPSRYVTSIESVTVGDVEVADDKFVWSHAGYIKLLQPQDVPGSAYTQEDWMALRGSWATVDFTHGYSELPYPIRQVGMELVANAIASPNAAYTAMSAGPFHVSLGEFGMTLSRDQLRVLGGWKVIDF